MMYKKGLLIGSASLLAVATAFFFFLHTSGPPALPENDLPRAERAPRMKKPFDKQTRMDLAMEQYVQMTKDPALGYVPNERLWESYRNTEKQRTEVLRKLSKRENMKITNSIAGVTWVERGPNNVAGRTRAILIDANDGTGNTIFAASVSGGIWRTNNITQDPPNWVSIDDFFDNMNITAIAQDPTNSQVIYFGTGEGYFNGDAVKGNGIWKSTDGGTTWAQLPSTNTTNPTTCAGGGSCNFDYVQNMVVTSTGAVIAATRGRFTNRGGVFRSDDGGVNWTLVETGNGSRPWAADVKLASNGDLYASFGLGNSDGIYKSIDDGVTWTQVFTAGVNEARIELGVAPSDPNYVYALVEERDGGSRISRIIRTTNAGASWNNLSDASWSDQCAAPVTDFTRGQAFYDLCVAVDPNNREHVIIGGIDLLKSTDGGGSWTQISEWADCSSLEDVHADQHVIVFAEGSSDIMYVGNDGGIYRTGNASAAFPTFSSRGAGYNTTQFYGCAMHPDALSNHFLAGSQDNGSQRFSDPGMNSTVMVTGGDGAFCNIDQDEPQYQFTQYIYNRFRRSTNGGSTFTNINAGDDGKFINPSDYDDVNNLMYSSTADGFYKRWNDPQTGSSFTNVDISAAIGTNGVSAIRVSPNTPNRLFIGTDGGRVVRVDNAHAAPTVANITGGGFPSGYVTCVEVETGNDDHLLVTFSNYGVASVWETIDGGASWTDVEGDLPDMPVRWALFNPDDANQAMLATEIGVWSTDNINGGATDWEPSIDGLANVRTDMLQYRPSDKLVIAATHGRGLFSSDVFANPVAVFASDKQLDYIGNAITFTDASLQATSWLWDFGDGNTSTDQHPVHAYSDPGLYEVSLTINGGVSSEVKTGYIHILPNRGTPYVPADGGNFEVNVLDFGSQSVSGGTDLWERGVPSHVLTTVNSPVNAWKTDLDADIVAGTYRCVLQSPNFNFTAPGTYTLRFRKSMEVAFCNAPYAVQVHYTIDKGGAWTRLGTDNDPNGTNWYERGPSSGCQVSSGIFGDQMGFANNYNNQLTTYDVSALAENSNVAFRFIVSVESGWSAAGYEVDGFMVDDFEIDGPPNVPTPVELADLRALFTGPEQVTVSWKTFSEVNNDRFEVQRSEEGSQFTTIGEVPGAGNSSTVQQYAFTDNGAVAPVYYYRLRQVDTDGTARYSGIVQAGRSRNFGIGNVYPVPFRDEVHVEFDRVPVDPVTILLIGETGKTHYRFSGTTGHRHTLRPAGTMAPGVYVLRVISANGILERKVLKY